jgi:uncharacterized membrane protein
MSSERYDVPTETTGWVDWGIFAATMMVLGGVLNIVHGLVALLNDDWAVWSNSGAVYLDLTTWGWVHILVGSLVILAGIGVLSGNVLARTVGVFLAGLSLVTNFLYMPVYPVWSITVIVLDVLMIWALTAHGREMRAPR